MELQELINKGEIESVPPNAKDARLILEKAANILAFVEKSIDDPQNFREVLNNNIYDCLRLTSHSILAVNGFRVKSRAGFHLITLKAAGILAGDKLSAVFLRLQKMRKARNIFEYGTYSSVSDAQLKQGYEDAKQLITTAGGMIKAKDQRLPLPE